MHKSNRLKAVSCLSFSLFIITLFQVIMKVNTLSIPLMVTFRGILIVTANYLYRVVIQKTEIDFYPQNYLFLNLSGALALSLSNQLGFFSVRLISMGVANIIFQTQILWCQFISYLLFQKPLSLLRIRNIIISLIGILFIFQPSFLFSSESQSISIKGLIIAIFASIVQAIGNVFMGEASVKLNPTAQTSYLQFGHIIWGSFIQIETEINFSSQFTSINLLSLIVISIMTWISNYYYFKAFQLESVERIAPINCLHPIFSLVVDVVIFGMVPDLWTMVGFTSVLLATFSTIMDNIK